MTMKSLFVALLSLVLLPTPVWSSPISSIGQETVCVHSSGPCGEFFTEPIGQRFAYDGWLGSIELFGVDPVPVSLSTTSNRYDGNSFGDPFSTFDMTWFSNVAVELASVTWAGTANNGADWFDYVYVLSDPIFLPAAENYLLNLSGNNLDGAFHGVALLGPGHGTETTTFRRQGAGFYVGGPLVSAFAAPVPLESAPEPLTLLLLGSGLAIGRAMKRQEMK